MAQNTTQVKILSSGDVYVAPIGSTAPTNATTALTAAWKKLGYLSTDGPGITPGLDTFEISGWQSAYPLRRGVTGRSLEVSFTMEQLYSESVKLAFGGGTISGTSPDYTYTPPAPSDTDDRAVVIEGIDGTTQIRLYIPAAAVTTVGQVQFQRGAAAAVPITMAAIGQAGVDIVKIFISDANFTVT